MDGLVRTTALTGLMASVIPGNTVDECAFTLCTIAISIMSIYNHVLCHAESRDFRIPGWIRALQRASILPDIRFHRTHHRHDIPDAHHLH